MKYLKLFESFSGRISENLQYHIDNNKPIVENVFRPGSNKYFDLIKEARELFDNNQIELSDLDTELYESTDIGRFVEYEGKIVPLDLPMETIEELNESILKNPHQMVIGSQYKITEPVYDDYDEGLNPETDLVEVVGKNRFGFILKNIDHNFTYERTFQHLMNCEIEDSKVELNEAKCQGREVKLNYPMRGGTKKYQVFVKNPKTGNVKKIAFGDVHGGLTAKVSNPKARSSFAARHKCSTKKDRTTAGYWACRINKYGHLWNGRTYPGYW